MRHVLKFKLVTGMIILTIIIILAGCGKSYAIVFDFNSIKNFRDIPEITEEEINAIEEIIENRDSLIYGSLTSTELFQQSDGTYSGFTIMICQLLTELFDIKFEIQIYDWSELELKTNSLEIDFIGALTPTPERMQRYFMSHPIAEHTLRLYTTANAATISSEADTNGLRIGFLEKTITASSIKKSYPNLHFEVVDIDNYKSVVEMMTSGEIDAFIDDADSDPAFSDYESIRAQRMFPLVYTPISILTANPELEPFISVINKYLIAGGADMLLDLYSKGEDEYAVYKLNRSFTEEERAYIDDMTARNQSVIIALESDNYPVNFYNESEKEFQGIALDIINKISGLTGLKFENEIDKNTDWAEIMQKAREGQVQMIAQLLYSEKRREHFIWSEYPYCTANYALLSKIDYPELSTSQVLRKKVGYTKQSAQADVYKEWFPDSGNIIGYNNLYEGMNALDMGEVDLYMGSEYVLLNLTNFREQTGFKINILLSTPMESLFGFNKNETILCSIVSKAQTHINTESIARYWTSKTYDYTKKAASERTKYIILFALLMFLLLLMSVGLLVNNRRFSKNLEKLVNSRTLELERKTATLSTIYKAIPDIVFSMNTICSIRAAIPALNVLRECRSGKS